MKVDISFLWWGGAWIRVVHPTSSRDHTRCVQSQTLGRNPVPRTACMLLLAASTALSPRPAWRRSSAWRLIGMTLTRAARCSAVIARGGGA